jgi:anti-anti-sigma factor
MSFLHGYRSEWRLLLAVNVTARNDPGLSVETHTAREGVAEMTVAGELDLATSPRLREAVEVCLGESVRTLVIDLRDVTFIDSTGLRTLVFAKQLADDLGAGLLLGSPSDAVMQLLKLVGLENQFVIVDQGPGATSPGA